MNKRLVKLCIRGGQRYDYLQALHQKHIHLLHVYEEAEQLFASVYYEDLSKARALRRKYGLQVQLTYASQRFLQPQLKIIIGIVLLILMPIVAQRYYWIIDVKAPKIEQKVKAERYVQKLSIPLAKNNIQKVRDLANELSKEIDEVAYVHVQQKGSALIFSLQPAPYIEPQLQEGTERLIAAKSGVIDRYFVVSGQLIVKKGDTVKKGDILVEDTLQQNASGKVYAEYLLTVQFKLPVEIRYYTKTKTRNVKLTEKQIESIILPLIERKFRERSAHDTKLSLQKLLHVTFDNDTVKGEVLYLVNENIAIPSSKRARR